ncbi:MAG: hypothetical protein ACI9OD_000542 [Limisphaerales bacterium]|jgi:hypothetical protein
MSRSGEDLHFDRNQMEMHPLIRITEQGTRLKVASAVALLLVQIVSFAVAAPLLSIPARTPSIINLSEIGASGGGRQLASPNAETNFAGLVDNLSVVPPDASAAVGINHLGVAANSQFIIQDRAGAIQTTVNLVDFWAGFVGVNGRVVSPKLFYDGASNRWVLSTCANPGTPDSRLLLAASLSEDPTQLWARYAIEVDTNAQAQLWGENVGLGHNSEWVVATKNLRNILFGGFNRTRIYLFDKSSIYLGLALGTNSFAEIDDVVTPDLMPAVSHDASPGIQYFLANGSGNDLQNNGSLRMSRLTEVSNVFTLSQLPAPTIGMPWGDLPNAGDADFAPQTNTLNRVWNGTSKIQNLVLRNGSLWAAQTVFLPAGAATRSAAQWWQINPNGTVVQTGRVDDSTGLRYFAFPSIAVNRNNDLLLGYSSFSALQHPSASYSFRFGTDLPNILQPEVVYRVGDSPYYKPDVSGRNLWGRSSSTVVDPTTDQDMWTLQQYGEQPLSSVDRWGTWWAKILLSALPDGNLEVVVEPSSGSLVPAGVFQTFTAKVFDTFSVTDAVISVSAPGFFAVENFKNDGLGADAIAGDNIYTLELKLPVTNSAAAFEFQVTATGKNRLSFTNTYIIAPPPVNDAFVKATKLPDANEPLIITNRNFFATTEIAENPHVGVSTFGGSVWWTWAPTLSGPVLIDTLGSRFNTLLAVYTGNTLASLSNVASNNIVTDAFGQFVREQAFVQFNAIAGVTYRIAIAGATTNDFGDIRMRLAFGGQPDGSAPQITITNIITGGVNLLINNGQLQFGGTNLNIIGTNLNRTKIQIENGNIVVGRTNLIIGETNIVMGGVSVTNPPSGLIVTNSETVISGFSTDNLPDDSGVNLIQVVGNSAIPANANLGDTNAVATNYWSHSLDLDGGSNRLEIVAFDLARNRGTTNFVINVREFDPVFDVFGAALTLVDNTGFVVADNTKGSFELNEPNHANKIGGKSLWFSFRAPVNGVLELTTTNSTFDTLLAVYSGTRVNELTVLESNDDELNGFTHSAISVGVVSGQSYRIAVDGLGGVSGIVNLHYTFSPRTVHTLSISNSTGGTVNHPSGTFLTGTSFTASAVPSVGFEFVTWSGSVLALDNPLTFTVASNMTLMASFARTQITDDFEEARFSTGVAWTNLAGTTPWRIQVTNGVITNVSLGGAYMARSGLILDGEISDLSLTAGMRGGAASFAYRVSSEEFDDVFSFYLNGVQQISTVNRSGDHPWRTHSFVVASGTNTLRWVYSKDVDIFDGGQDSVFIDNVQLPLLLARLTNFVSSFNTNGTRIQADGNLQMRLEGQTNQIYVIQSSSDLIQWETLGTNHAPHGIIQFKDSTSTNHTRRYYRAFIP